MSETVAEKTVRKKDRLTKAEKSWIFYDWANSVYATNIMAAIFPIYFATICATGDTVWAFGSALSTMIVALCAPLLGAIGDYKGMKKKLFCIFLFIGTFFTLTMAIFNQWQLVIVGYIISYIGFSGANLFYDSFLTDVTTKEKMDKVSTYGFAMGYIGGSTIAFLLSLGIMLALGLEKNLALGVKISVVITTVWWAVFSIPLLKNVKQEHYVETPKNQLAIQTLKNMLHTAKTIMKNKGIFFFMLAYFFYIDGVNTVIRMATAYGTTLGLDMIGMILALLVTQLVAIPCSILFSYLAKKFGSMRMIFSAVVIYMLICIVGFYMGYSVEAAPSDNADLYTAAIDKAQVLFWIMAVLVGTVQGGIQALSRSYYGKLIPPERSNEFFGFYDIFGKFAAVLGPFLYGIISSATGSSAYGIASVSVLFMIAAIIIIIGRKSIKSTEKGNA